MKKELCMMAIGLLLAGCSADEEIANVHTSESNVIGFNVVSNNPQTKATIINSTNDLQHWSLGVFALKGGEPFMGTQAEDIEGYDDIGVKLIHQDGAWNYANPADEHYWPHSEPLDFYAIAPYTSNNISWNQILTSGQITVHTIDEIDNPLTPNDDIMYAVALEKTKEGTNGIVPLSFQHLFSQVSFQAKTSGERLYVAIESMNLCNVYSFGIFTFPSTTYPNGNWSFSTDDLYKSTYQVIPDESAIIHVNPGDEATDISGSNTMLLIPQHLTPWQPTSPIVEDGNGVDNAIVTRESYLKIKCKIWQNTSSGIHYLLGGASDYDYSYVPFPATWESGKHYKYTLIFGGGYNADGEEIDINPICFDVSVSDWQTETPDMDIDNPLAGGE